MLSYTLHIAMADLEMPGAKPLTRAHAIELATRHANNSASSTVRIVIVIDHEDGIGIEMAAVELSNAPDGVWWLQYVSHPKQSSGLTEEVVPCKSDFVAFVRARQVLRLPEALTPFCAEDLDDDGLGPLDGLNLRPFNPAPIVPTKHDLDQLMGCLSFANGDYVALTDQ